MPRTSCTYRVTENVIVELNLESKNSTGSSDLTALESIQSLEYGENGARRISLVNFTGNLVFYEASAEESGKTEANSQVLYYECCEIPLEDESKDIVNRLSCSGDITTSVQTNSVTSRNGLNQVCEDENQVASPPTSLDCSPSEKGESQIESSFQTASPTDVNSLHQTNETLEQVLPINKIAAANKVSAHVRNGWSETRAQKHLKRRSNRTSGGLYRKVMRCQISDSILELRNLNRFHARPELNCSPLHVLCSLPEVTLEELWGCFNQDPTAVRIKDSRGRYPLHVIGDNEILIGTIDGREVATSFTNHLIDEYPSATTTPDCDGFVPFARIIGDWIDWALNRGRDMEDPTLIGNSPDLPSPYYPGRRGLVRPNASYWSKTVSTITIFPRVQLWEEVEWCFDMLSTTMNVLGRHRSLPMYLQTNLGIHSHGNRSSENDFGHDCATLVEKLVTKLPNLMYTVLLVDDDGSDSRKHILETVLFRRIFLCAKVVGNWVVDMLNHGGVPAKRAVDYLVAISYTSIEDDTGGFGAPNKSDWDRFYRRREEVFDKVGALEGTISSLVPLDGIEIERAASTTVIWYIMNSKLSRPFVMVLVLIDLVLHLVLMVCFRTVASLDESFIDVVGIRPYGLVYAISIHYLLRKCCEVWVLLTRSTSAWGAYFANIWTVFDAAATLLTLVATVLQDWNKQKLNTGLNALAMGLLWMKVLGFLKVINKDMSTFILALIQILYNIRFFVVVLVVWVFMFGDLFFIAVSTKDDGQYCSAGQEVGAIEDFCTSAWASYLRVYAILLGDFELDNMKATTGTTVLFLIFTIFGIIILLNVLIAVISDSYQKATSSSALFFGRARVLYVAQNEVLEELLKPSVNQEGETSGPEWRIAAKQMLRWAVLLAILGTAIYSLVYLTQITIALVWLEIYFPLIFMSILTVLLLCALLIGVSFLFSDRLIWHGCPVWLQTIYQGLSRISWCFVKWTSNVLFGLDNSRMHGEVSRESPGEADLYDRVKYLEQVIGDTRKELKSEIVDMRSEVLKRLD